MIAGLSVEQRARLAPLAEGNGAAPYDEATGLQTLRRLDIERMLREAPPPVPWRVEPLIADGYLTMLFGSPGEGKSLLAAALSAGIALGEDLAGFVCRRGRVAYVDAENGEREIHRRVRSLGLPAEGIALYEPEQFDLRRGGIEALERVAAEEEANLLVLDSLRTLAPGLDENDPAQTSAALDPLRDLAHRRELAILTIHHANKGGRDYRGSSAILASVELAFRFARADGDSDRERRFLSPWKFRLGPEPERRWLALTVDKDMVLIRQAEEFESEAATPEAPKRARLGGEIVAVLENGQQLPLADLARAVGESPKSGTVRRALDQLVAEGEVEKLESGCYRGCQGATAPIGDGTLAPPGEGSTQACLEGAE